MDKIEARIIEVIEQSGLKKIQFAEKLGISSAYVSQLCAGVRTPSDRTIADICREFRISRTWLETGEGPMRLPEPEEDLDYINDLLSGDSDEVVRFVRRFLRTYRELTPERQQVMQDFIRKLHDEK